MKKGLWKRRAFAFLVAAAMVIPQGVYAAETEGHETLENVSTEEVPEKVHEEGCVLAPDHEGDCVTAPAENTEEQPERVHEEGCVLAPDHEGDCVTTPAENTEEQPERVHEEGCVLAPDHEGNCVITPAENTEEQPERVHEEGCVLPSDHEGECETEQMPMRAPEAGEVLTVGEGGRFASLADAVAEANASDETDITIELLSDITAEKCARITDKEDISKNITINGNGFTVTRGDNFETISDNNRSWYNPAMIEVTSPNSMGATLTLVNITLDDAGKHMGENFSQQKEISDPDKGDNLVYVQDAIVAAYGTNAEQPNANIVLDKDAVLKNYGGESAVRIIRGASLTMKEGSQICDDSVSDRPKETGAGRYGAVWVQGTNMTMEKGSAIRDMTGRGIFLEVNATAEVNGTIQNIKNAAGMKNGANGVAIYVYGDSRPNYGHSVATLGPDGHIDGIQGTSNNNDGAVSLQYGKFVMEENSKISNVTKTPAIYLNDSKHNTEDTAKDNGAYINGIIEYCSDNNYIFRPRLSDFTLEENGVVQNCTATFELFGANAIFYSTDGANYTFKGQIINNTADNTIWLGRHQNVEAFATIEDGALISGNSGKILVTNGSHLTMTGGEISNNQSGLKVEGKSNMENASFVMTGGTISNNKSGISYTIAGKSIVRLEGGTITGNGTNYQISASGGSAKDANEYIYINQDVLQGNKSVYLSAGTVTLDQDYTQVSLGKASTNAKNEIANLVAAEHPTWKTVGYSTLWIKPETDSYHFQFKPTSTPDTMGLYVAYIPVDADGEPEVNAVLQMKEVANEDIIDITLDGLDPTKAYAVMLVNNDTYVLSPEDITIYTGGDDYETTHGLPEDYTLRGIGKISSIKVGDVETEYKTYIDEDQKKALEDLKALLKVEYMDDNGNVLQNDTVPGDYVEKITFVDPTKDVKINGNNVKLKDGKLIIRYIEDEDEAISGESVIQLLEDEPTEPLTEHAVGVAVEGSKYYINNDEDREVSDSSQISLLDDGLLTSGNDGRQELMEQRANEIVKPSSGMKNVFKFHYLDLVDPNTGNAWVSSSEGTIVYLPYPEGTDQNTDFTLLHYNDLHREYGINGHENVAAAIAHSRIEKVDFTKEAAGIRFEVPQSGFSPFAIIWEEKDTDDGGSSSGGGSHTSNTYYVRYHNDDDTERDGKFIPGETVTVKGNVFTAPVGKMLAGWSLEEGGKVDYKAGDTFRMPGSSVDLYAVWKDAETESHSAYISGYPDGTVGPDKTITRAEAATMFYNLLADKNGDAKTFTDVPANQWYAKAVTTLAGKGVISGYPDGTFKPNAPITRAEFVTMAMNFADADKGTACSFPDVPQNMWYYGAIAGATQNGWISGYPDGTFGPDRYITRAEVTSVINRMENRAADMSFMMDHLNELRTFSDLSFGHWAYGSMMEAANGHDYTRADQNSYESWVDIH